MSSQKFKRILPQLQTSGPHSEFWWPVLTPMFKGLRYLILLTRKLRLKIIKEVVQGHKVILTSQSCYEY